MSIDDKIQSEIDRITGQSPNRTPMRKIADNRVSKSPFKKAAEKFFEVDFDEIKRDIKRDAVRKILSAIGDVLNIAIDKIFRQKPSNKNYGSGVVRTYDSPSYRDYSSIKQVSTTVAPATTKYTFSDLKFSQRSNAQALLDAMNEAIAANGSVTVTELYDALDDPSNLEPTDGYFGWKNLEAAYIKEEGGLYRLYLPPVVSFK